jgi:hypothetical protein
MRNMRTIFPLAWAFTFWAQKQADNNRIKFGAKEEGYT